MEGGGKREWEERLKFGRTPSGVKYKLKDIPDYMPPSRIVHKGTIKKKGYAPRFDAKTKKFIPVKITYLLSLHLSLSISPSLHLSISLFSLSSFPASSRADRKMPLCNPRISHFQTKLRKYEFIFIYLFT
jgi:hypothetical protein